jgi:hypothetical protein
MTEREIIEGNKLINTFLMGELHDSGGVRYYEGEDGFQHESGRYLKYHSFWNWLMPVVEKVEELGYCVFIQNDCCWMKVGRAGMKMPHISHLCDSKIEAVFKAVAEFIQWNNSKNNPNTK